MTAGIKDFALFTDVSVSPDVKLGVGVYIMVPASFLNAPFGVAGRPDIAGRLKVRRFEDTTSTKLELQTVLWALSDIRQGAERNLTIYSDSQCVVGLLKRKSRLLSGGFISNRTGQPLKNASLYRTFYELHEKLGFQVVKVAGHSGSCVNDAAGRIFSIVNTGARKALKIWLKESAKAQSETDSGPWCVYVLRCSNNALYIGMTNDLERRMEKHTLGIGSKFVRSWRPFELVKTIPCRNAGEAKRLEFDLKGLTRQKKIEVLGIRMNPQ